MIKFKEGDRVAVYQGPLYKGSRGSVTSTCHTGELHIAVDQHSVQLIVWPQQCRKLMRRKRRKVLLRSEWVAGAYGGDGVLIMRDYAAPWPGFIEFIEVRKKKS